jgi:GT2 family glycosyltransferase
MKTTDKTNIIMLVKGRLRLTMQSINSLYLNTPHDAFYLTIVDDESDEPTHNCIQQRLLGMKNYTILRVTQSRGITGQVRNLGVYWAEKYWGPTRMIYLSDNDVFFTPGWLKKMLDAWVTSWGLGYRVLAGSTHPFHQWNVAHQIETEAGEVLHLRAHDAVSGYSHLMHWETWHEYGPLDAHGPGTGMSEDFAFCQKIVNAGFFVGSLFPEVVYACGLTNTAGDPAVGAHKMTRYKGVIQQ